MLAAWECRSTRALSQLEQAQSLYAEMVQAVRSLFQAVLEPTRFDSEFRD
jgi:hypothetical protein